MPLFKSLKRNAKRLDADRLGVALQALAASRTTVPYQLQGALLNTARKEVARAPGAPSRDVGIASLVQGLADVGWATSQELRKAVLAAVQNEAEGLLARGSAGAVHSALAILGWTPRDDVHDALRSIANRGEGSSETNAREARSSSVAV